VESEYYYRLGVRPLHPRKV